MPDQEIVPAGLLIIRNVDAIYESILSMKHAGRMDTTGMCLHYILLTFKAVKDPIRQPLQIRVPGYSPYRNRFELYRFLLLLHHQRY